jgi:hypothetical protein
LDEAISTGVFKAQFFTQLSKGLLLGSRQHTKLQGDLSGMGRKNPAYQFSAFIGKVHNKKAPVGLAALTFDQLALLKIIDNHGHIAAAAENFLADLTLRHWPNVVKDLQNTKLAEGQPESRELAVNPGGYRFRCPHQFDIGVQGPGSFGVVFSFWQIITSTLNSLTLN